MKRFFRAVLLCGLMLVLGGCAWQKDAGKTASETTESESVEFEMIESETTEPKTAESEMMESAEEETTQSVCENLPEMEESPLIYAEHPENENMADMLQKASAGMMVQITAGDLSGSGILWKMQEENVVILTAGHVLARTDGNVQITFSDGLQLQARNFLINEEVDLAFVTVDKSEIPVEHAAEYCLANVDEDSAGKLQRGDRIIVMASATGVAVDAYEGKLLEPWIYVEDFGQYMMLVKADAEPGESGGGIFDERGCFLGILCGENMDGELAAVPVSVISAFSENF